MIDTRAQVGRLEEFDRIQVSNVNASIVRIRAFWAVFLDVQAKETYVYVVDLLEGEHGYNGGYF